MKKLNLDKQDSEAINNAINHWEKDGLLNAEQAQNLRLSITIKGFDWMRLAKYSFWIALFCGIVALVSLLINESIITLLKQLYKIPDSVFCLTSTLFVFLSFYYGQYRTKKHPEKVFSNQTMIFFGVLFTSIAILFLGKTFNDHLGHFSILILLASFVYGFLAFYLQSRLIWFFALLALGCWFGTETGYQTNWDYYFLGMNYPLRFFVFGFLIVLSNFLIANKSWFRNFGDLTYIAGLSYLFISLWVLSLFGNLNNLDTWWHVKQINLIYWSIFTLIIGIGWLLYGLKNADAIAREFGITFILIFFYTKYFELFWTHSNKTIFFSILALSFWLIGRRAEKIWNIKK